MADETHSGPHGWYSLRTLFLLVTISAIPAAIAQSSPLVALGLAAVLLVTAEDLLCT